MPNRNDFDVLVIGAGHNGLTAAAYLAKSGLSVKVLERRHIVGGAAVTEEFHPGFRNSTCSYTVSLLNPKIISDLELARHGLRIIERPMSNFLPLGEESLSVFPETDLFMKEVARFSLRDSDRLEDYSKDLNDLAGVLRDLVLQTPPNAGGGLKSLWSTYQQAKPALKLDRVSQQNLIDIFTLSAADFLERYFEHDAIKALYAFDGIVGNMASPFAPGTAYVLLHHCFGEVNGKAGAWGHAIGGMGAISEAMAKAATEAGAEIEVSSPVAHIITEQGRAKGVELEDGRIIRARAIAANVGPKLLFEKMVNLDDLPSSFLQRMKNWKCVSGTLRMNVALKELPDFTCAPGKHQQPHHTGGIIMAPDMDYMDDAWHDARKYGFSRNPVVEMLIPSTIDDTLAPEGKHVASLFCQHFDPNLPDGKNWDDLREEAAHAVIETVTRYAPNFRDSILGKKVLTPLDLERDFGLVGGDIFHGALDLNQIFSLRPALGNADYRMPIKGLYLCGSGAHPGGGVSGAPGYNAAREIRRDL